MPTLFFTHLTRRAAAEMTRRHSLRALGGAALAATVIRQPQRTTARRKRGKTCQQREQQRCQQDFAACLNVVLLNCPTPGACGASLACCETCSATGFIACAVGSA